MAIDTSCGVKSESTYGTAVVVDRFFPLISENIVDNVEKLESASRRSGIIAQSADASVPIYMDSTGTLEIPVYSKDFGWWLTHLTGGAVSTTGPTDSAYTHTFALASHKGKSFTLQINRKIHDANTDQAFTWAGGKVTGWSLEAEAGGEVKCSIDCDFRSLATGTSLASASYPSGMEILVWSAAGSYVSLGGTEVPVTKFSLKAGNQLKTDRRYIQRTALKAEPVATDYRDIEWEAELDFSGLTQHNRYLASTNAGQYAALVFALQAPTLIGATTYPSLTFTAPKARYDKSEIDNSGMDPNMQTIGGKLRADSSGSTLSVAYVTSQSTP